MEFSLMLQLQATRLDTWKWCFDFYLPGSITEVGAGTLPRFLSRLVHAVVTI